jgi:hypothetical protein
MESNLELWIKQGYYKRYTSPKVNMYVTDPTYSYEALVIKILTNNYSMLEEFEGFYLYGPEVSGLRYFDIEKKRNQNQLLIQMSSINQFKYYNFDVDRADWPSLFGEAQNYWKEYLAFEDKMTRTFRKKFVLALIIIWQPIYS